MDTQAPVLRVPMEFVQLTRVVDPADKMKKVIITREASVLNETNPKVSTCVHPLRKYPLHPGGSADLRCQDDYQCNEGILSGRHANDQAGSKSTYLDSFVDPSVCSP